MRLSVSGKTRHPVYKTSEQVIARVDEKQLFKGFCFRSSIFRMMSQGVVYFKALGWDKKKVWAVFFASLWPVLLPLFFKKKAEEGGG